jgi:hypothetical protein
MQSLPCILLHHLGINASLLALSKLGWNLGGVWDGSRFQLQCGAVVYNINLNSLKIFLI